MNKWSFYGFWGFLGRRIGVRFSSPRDPFSFFFPPSHWPCDKSSFLTLIKRPRPFGCNHAVYFVIIPLAPPPFHLFPYLILYFRLIIPIISNLIPLPCPLSKFIVLPTINFGKLNKISFLGFLTNLLGLIIGFLLTP